MFGYVKTDLPNMYVKDTVLYKAMYCGLCKSIGGCCGNVGRFCLNYDLTFLSILLHNICDADVVIKKQHCIAHWLTKRPVAIPDQLSHRIASLNVLMAYHKIIDDVTDNGKGKVKGAFFKRTYKKAVKNEPELDKIIGDNYKDLLRYEKSGCDSIDMTADPFGNMIKQIVKNISNDHYTDELGELSYYLGKWIYLIDALDDYDKDIKKNNFNVFYNLYKESDKKSLLSKFGMEIQGVFSDILGTIFDFAKKLDYKFNHDLIDNVLLCGLKEQTKKIMGDK